MKRFILVLFVFALTCVIQSTAQLPSRFNDCYQDEFNNCTNCTPEQRHSIDMPYQGCNVRVTYVTRTCDCPQPQVFIEIVYFRINISTPQACCDLICQLFPPGPYTQNCGNHSLHCINNPPDHVAYKQMGDQLYDDLLEMLFNQVKDQYDCPNEYSIKYYWPSECFGFCTYDLQEVGPSGRDEVLMIPTACNDNGCCEITHTYCKDQSGNIVKTVTGSSTIVNCGPEQPPHIQCSIQVGTQITFGTTNYVVTRVRNTPCQASCNVE